MSRLRGFLWLTAGLIVAFLAAIIAYMTLSRAAQMSSGQVPVEGAYQQVVTVARPVAVRSLLTADMLMTQELPVASVPEGAAAELDQVVGKMTLSELYTGEVVLLQRLVDPDVISGDGRLAVALESEQVLVAMPAADLLSQIALLKPGDKVDILVSMDFPLTGGVSSVEAAGGKEEEKQVTFALLQNVTIAALPGAEQPKADEEAKAVVSQAAAAPQALLVILAPQDALLLKYALDAGGIQDIALRAPGVDQEWETEPVDVDYIIDRHKIPVQ